MSFSLQNRIHFFLAPLAQLLPMSGRAQARRHYNLLHLAPLIPKSAVRIFWGPLALWFFVGGEAQARRHRGSHCFAVTDGIRAEYNSTLGTSLSDLYPDRMVFSSPWPHLEQSLLTSGRGSPAPTSAGRQYLPVQMIHFASGFHHALVGATMTCPKIRGGD
ncbi:hypothetical protein C8R47DRAFT_1080821 [Mycena vitilis]|nr:hypothetical protein C8R47DRAFT_1080821 [Mycena vitilis]